MPCITSFSREMVKTRSTAGVATFVRVMSRLLLITWGLKIIVCWPKYDMRKVKRHDEPMTTKSVRETTPGTDRNPDVSTVPTKMMTRANGIPKPRTSVTRRVVLGLLSKDVRIRSVGRAVRSRGLSAMGCIDMGSLQTVHTPSAGDT